MVLDVQLYSISLSVQEFNGIKTRHRSETDPCIASLSLPELIQIYTPLIRKGWLLPNSFLITMKQQGRQDPLCILIEKSGLVNQNVPFSVTDSGLDQVTICPRNCSVTSAVTQVRNALVALLSLSFSLKKKK